MDDIAIKVEHLSKVFKLPHEKTVSVKSAVVNMGRRDRGYDMQKALDNVSFEVRKGEFFGIVGRNGSGKSTLLKLLAGIYVPSKGSVHVNGTLTPFIELGVGFNPELTGRENVYLNGALLGFSRKEMRGLYNGIVEFAELGKFMDLKLKNYSSGMQVRLAFSIAIQVKSDILVLDEVLAVGDANFQRKCYDYFSQIKQQKRTIIFVSHDMDAIRNFCDRVVLIDSGRLVEEGNSYDVTKKYTQLNLQNIEAAKPKTKGGMQQSGEGQARIEKVWTSSQNRQKSVFEPLQAIEFNVRFTARQSLSEPVVGISVQDAQDRVIYATNTKEEGAKLGSMKRGQVKNVSFRIDNHFTNGSYFISCAVADNRLVKTYARAEKAQSIIIDGWRMPHSLTHLPAKVKVD